MKKIYVPFAIAFLFLISSCSKDTTTPIPVPTDKVDTLTAGWKKIIVDTSETYADVYFNNNTTGYLVGDKTYKSTDGGLNWTSDSRTSHLLIWQELVMAMSFLQAVGVMVFLNQQMEQDPLPR